MFNPWPFVAAIILALAGLLGVQTMRLNSAQADLAQAQTNAAQAQIAYQQRLNSLEQAHATAQQENTHAYNEKLAKLNNAHADDAATIERLRTLLTSATPTTSEAYPAASGGESYRLSAVPSLFLESIDILAEGRGIIERRDAEVALLVGQIAIDRKACESGYQTDK
jgi:multidrug resistance efflux pump